MTEAITKTLASAAPWLCLIRPYPISGGGAEPEYLAVGARGSVFFSFAKTHGLYFCFALARLVVPFGSA